MLARVNQRRAASHPRCGEPMQNAVIESFNARSIDQCERDAVYVIHSSACPARCGRPNHTRSLPASPRLPTAGSRAALGQSSAPPISILYPAGQIQPKGRTQNRIEIGGKGKIRSVFRRSIFAPAHESSLGKPPPFKSDGRDRRDCSVDPRYVSAWTISAFYRSKSLKSCADETICVEKYAALSVSKPLSRS